MGAIWILGAGRFGLRAANLLVGPAAAVEHLIIDADAGACRTARRRGHTAVCRDAVEFLHRHLDPAAGVDWVIPAVPVHVAFQWLARRTAAGHRVEKCELPADLIDRLPNPIKADHGTCYTSIARFVCPEDCPEPPDVCWVTQKPRPCRVDEVLAAYRSSHWLTVVVRSHSLAPGVGGLRPRQLFEALSAAEATSRRVILATACRCHGVVDAFSLTPKPPGRKTV